MADFNLVAYIDSLDLRHIHYVAAMSGAILALFVQGLLTTGQIKMDGDFTLSIQFRRIGLIGLGLALCWSLYYSDLKEWKPWPSDVAFIIALDIFLLSSVIVAARRKRLLR